MKKLNIDSINSINIKLFFTLFTFCMSQIGLAQDSTKKDSIKKASLVERLQKLGKEEAARSVDKFVSEQKRLKQNELIRQLQTTIQNAKSYLKRDFDTAAIQNELAKVEGWHEIANDGVFTNKGTAQTHRNLTTTEKLINELHQRVAEIKSRVDGHQNKLYRFQYQIDSLFSDSVLYEFPSDSAATASYFQLLVHSAKELSPTDSALRKFIDRNEVLQYKVNDVLNRLSFSLDEINRYETELFSNNFSRDFPNIWQSSGYHRPIGEIIYNAKQKGTLTLGFYLQNHFTRIIVCFLIIVTISIFLISLKKLLAEQKRTTENFTVQLVLRYPPLSAFLIGASLLQFIFPNPPFIFEIIIWTASALSLTFIFKGYITQAWMKIWLTLFFLFILASADNLILQASRIERWWMLALSFTGIVFPAMVLLKAKKTELKEKAILYFIAFVALLEFPALVANVFGRYNLGKTLLVSGFVNVIIAIIFLWVVRLLNQTLKLASIAYSKQDKKLFYINFEKVGDSVPTVFYMLLVVGWFVLFGRNFYAFRLITTPVEDFLMSERTLGDFTFSISNIFLFLFIIVMAAIASKLVSFFASDQQGHHVVPTSKAKARMGSWLLLIRIFIISLGVFLAFAATGIPMDKLTIILGALSVGIGLGLQALVNNLVSGLILAFEKPVNVGDMVQIGGQYGRMKSIGFRGSIISTQEGADVTIPNGELLNSHLINWTMGGKNSRRVEINVGVGYNSDLNTVTSLITGILTSDNRILKFPEPTVLISNLNTSSIDTQLLFWVQDIREVSQIKSDVIKNITHLFKEKNIEIPFPQQDIHIKTSFEKEDKKQI